MHRPDSETAGDLTDPDARTAGDSMSTEMERLRQALAIKVEKHGAHYSDVKPLGAGSFGEVHSARDELLGREVAIKSLKQHNRENDDVVYRFLKEARGTAQLEHPNIMPVHEMGVSDEFGIYFTMKKIEGENLKEILDRLRANPSFYEKSYPLGVLLEIFLAVCNGVAFAHSKGVIHRDLKPANIMVGKYGEVLILDWGLVKQIGVEELPDGRVQLLMDEADSGAGTLDGAISGTPNYMSPEQAAGHLKDVDVQSDVYSMGAILYHLLTYHPPFEKVQINKLLNNVKTGHFIPPRKRFPERRIPRELEAICLKAMSLHPVVRYRSMELFAQDLRNYIGHQEVVAYRASRVERLWKVCLRNPVKSAMTAATTAALLLVFGAHRTMLYGSYRSNMARAVELQTLGDALIDEATAQYDALQALSAASELKEETPAELELRKFFAESSSMAAAKFNVAEMLYDSLPEPYRSKPAVYEGYVRLMQSRIEFALYCRQYDQARQWLETIRLRIAQRSVQVDVETAHDLEKVQRSIDGKGRLEVTGPDSVHSVIVWPLFDSDELPRKIQGDAVKRGRLPLRIDELDKGSYVVQVTCGDGRMLPYPVHIDHGEQRQLALEIPETVPAGMVYVPEGEFIFGGDDSRFYRWRKHSLPAFFIGQHEVTVAEYLEFWKELDDPELKTACMSRIRFRSEDRRYDDAWSDTGVLKDERLSLAYPVVGITREAAEAFCEWKSRRTGDLFRLPTVAEWEKAARGVDGRRYVWGNGFSGAANLALTRANEMGKERFPLWAPPGSFPRDVSVYGAYDMAGNVREMTCTPLPGSTEFYQFKGGSASTPENFLPCSNSSDTPVVPSDVGFRYIQEIPGRP